MKNLLCSLAALFSLNAFALDQPPVAVPTALKCKEILNVYGLAKLKRVNLTAVRLADARIFQSEENDIFLIDFTDGDQIEKFEFKREEIDSLDTGKIGKVRGVRTQGFAYADGEHTTGLTVVECAL